MTAARTVRLRVQLSCPLAISVGGDAEQGRAVELVLRPDARATDLWHALEECVPPGAGPGVWHVERTGTVLQQDSPLVGPGGAIRDGDLLVRSRADPTHSSSVFVLTDLAAGSTGQWRLPSRCIIGRDGNVEVSIDDAQVSAEHASISTESGMAIVSDLASRNGTFIDGMRINEPKILRNDDVLTVGATHLRLSVLTEVDTAVDLAPRPWPRPVIHPATVHALEARPSVPVREDWSTGPDRRNRLAGGVLLLSALVLIIAMVLRQSGEGRDQWSALVVLTSLGLLAIIGFGRWLARDRRAAKVAEGTARAAATAWCEEIVSWHRTFELVHPPPDAADDLVATAWSASPGMQLRVGVAAVGSADLRALSTWPQSIRDEMLDALEHTMTPVLLDPDGSLDLDLEPADALGLARWLLVQRAALASPQHLVVVIVTDRQESWTWARWLPHRVVIDTPSPSPSPDALHDATTLLEAVSKTTDGAHQPHAFVVWDVREAPSGRLCARLREGQLRKIVQIVRVQAPRRHGDQDPVADDLVWDRTISSGTSTRGLSGTRVVPAVVDTISTLAGLETSRHLFVIGENGRACGLRPALSLVDLLDPATTLTRRTANPRSVRIPAAIGLSSEGVVTLDVERDGPHVIVTGTEARSVTGLLVTAVCALALENDQDVLGVLLVGSGSAEPWDPLRRLPHCWGAVPLGVPENGERLSRFLRAELERRQRRTLHASPDAVVDGSPHTPSLVVVVDDIVDAQRLPELFGVLVDIARIGREFGVHLILGTTAPVESIGRDLVACAKTRFLVGEASTEIAGDGLGRRTASDWAVMTSSSDDPVPFQVATTALRQHARHRNRRVSCLPLWSAPGESPPSMDHSSLDLEFIVEHLVAGGPHDPMHRRLGPKLPYPIAEPDVACHTSAARGSLGFEDAMSSHLLGVYDDPEEAMQGPWRLGLDRGLVLAAAPFDEDRRILLRRLHATEVAPVVIGPETPADRLHKALLRAEAGELDLLVVDRLDRLIRERSEPRRGLVEQVCAEAGALGTCVIGLVADRIAVPSRIWSSARATLVFQQEKDATYHRSFGLASGYVPMLGRGCFLDPAPGGRGLLVQVIS